MVFGNILAYSNCFVNSDPLLFIVETLLRWRLKCLHGLRVFQFVSMVSMVAT